MLTQRSSLRQRLRKNARMSRPLPRFQHKLPKPVRFFGGYRKLIYSLPIRLTAPLGGAVE